MPQCERCRYVNYRLSSDFFDRLEENRGVRIKAAEQMILSKKTESEERRKKRKLFIVSLNEPL